MYKEGVALKRKMVFPLFRTINVCGEENRTSQREDRTTKRKRNIRLVVSREKHHHLFNWTLRSNNRILKAYVCF